MQQKSLKLRKRKLKVVSEMVEEKRSEILKKIDELTVNVKTGKRILPEELNKDELIELVKLEREYCARCGAFVSKIMPKEPIREIFAKIEEEGKEVCDIERVIGENPVTKEKVDYVIIKTCPRSD